MICSASCGNRVATRCDSASAVCFIGPQRPSAIIENDRSTQSATAAEARRSVSTTSKSSTSSRTGSVPAAGGRRRTALPTVRTTSSGCSSPNSQRRDAPVSSPAAPGVAQVVLAPPAAGRGRRRPCAARCRRAGAAPSGSASARPAPRVTQPCRRSSRSSSCSRRTSSAAAPAELPLDRLDVDVVQGGAGVLLAELVEQVVEVADLLQGAGRLAVAERLARRAPARRGPSCRSGRSARRLSVERGHLAGQRPSPSACSISRASSSRCCGRERAHQPLAGGGPPGQRVDRARPRWPGSPGRTRRAGA